MARIAARQLADMRALEKEANRSNPVRKGATPTEGVSEVRGGKKSKARKEHDIEGEHLREAMEAHKAEGRAMKGGRAVPSSGLSQFHGGGIVGAGHCDYESDSSEEMVGGSRVSKVYAREKSSKPALRTLPKDRLSEKDAMGMGRMLGKHIHEIHGSGFYDLFTKGVLEANKEEAAAESMEGGYLSGPYEGMGDEERRVVIHRPRARRPPPAYSQPPVQPPVQPPAKSEKAPKPAKGELTLSGRRMRDDVGRGASDGRKKRAEVVKKVMREKGLSMIEASKYVKAHNLY